MRISPVISQTVLNALNTADQAEQRALREMTTGRRVNLPSDDPAAASVEVGIAALSSQCDQFTHSISTVSSELQTADSALNSGLMCLEKAVALGIQGSNGTLSQPDRDALANQVSDMSQQLLGIANLSYNGKYLFGGTMISQPPYTTAGVYQGNDQVNHVEIDSGQVVAASQPGSQLFSKPGADVFASLSALATALQSSDSTVSDISTASVAVRAAYDQLNSARVFYGSTLDRLNSDQNFLSTEKLQLSQQMNATVGIDVNLAATDLVNAESARSATLAAAAKTDSLSLLDYLSAGSAG